MLIEKEDMWVEEVLIRRQNTKIHVQTKVRRCGRGWRWRLAHTGSRPKAASLGSRLGDFLSTNNYNWGPGLLLRNILAKYHRPPATGSSWIHLALLPNENKVYKWKWNSHAFDWINDYYACFLSLTRKWVEKAARVNSTFYVNYIESNYRKTPPIGRPHL